MRAVALLLALSLAGCSSIQLGNPLGTIDSSAPTLPIAEAWERDVQAAFGPSSATVTQRYVVVGTRRGEVVILDRETGATQGVGEFGISVEGRVAISEDGSVIYVPTAEKGGGVEAYDVNRGRRLWRWRGGAVMGGASRVGSVLVVPLLDSSIVGLDASTGDVLWTRPAREGVQIHAAPTIARASSGRTLDATVLIADDSGIVQRLSPLTGEPIWRVEVGAPIYTAPTATDGVVLVTTTRGAVVALEDATGQERWRLQTDLPLRASPATISGDRVVVGFTDGTVRALALENGTEQWRYRTDGNVTAAPIALEGHIAVGTMDRRLVLLDRETGVATWSTELRGRVKSALVVGGGLLIALVEPRHVIAFHSVP